MIPYEWPQVSEWDELPSHQYAETAILGAILLDNAAYPKLEPDDFSLESHRKIYLRIGEMLETKQTVDLVTLSNYLAGKTYSGGLDGERKPIVLRELDDVGGMAYLASLTEGLPRRPVIDEYVEILKEKARLRRIIAACEKASNQCREQGKSAAEIVEQLGVDLKGIRRKAAK